MRYKDLSETLVELRKSRGLTQQALGDELGVTNKTISKWENGVFLPDITYLVAIADIFNTSVDDLLRGTVYLQNTVIKNVEKNKKKRLNLKLSIILIFTLIGIDVFLLVFNMLNLNIDKGIRYTNVIMLATANALFLIFTVFLIVRKVKEKRREKRTLTAKKSVKM